MSRHKLIRTIWYVISRVGEENVRDIIERMYNHRRISALDNYQLKCVIDEIKDVTEIVLRNPVLKKKSKEKPHIMRKGDSIIELATKEQLIAINVKADKLKMKHETLDNMIRRATKGGLFTVLSAQAVLEALKSMERRGWREKRT